MNELSKNAEEETFYLNETLKWYLEENKEAATIAESATKKMNKEFDDKVEKVAKLKMIQEQTLKDEYKVKYIKAGNDYTE
jgi:hypothetical protein